MTITPDTKDWTWVVEMQCPECGFDASAITGPDVPERLAAEFGLWRGVLLSDSARERPAPTQWSALEYGCHVRDVCVLYDRRLHLLLDEDDPLFQNWDQDETALDQEYGQQDPVKVLDEIESAGATLMTSLRSVTAEQWERPGRRSDGAVFTIDTFARYFLHDIVHHGWDVSNEDTTG